MDQKWLANGTAVLVLDPGTGEPTIGDGNNGQKPNPDYRPALVAVLVTEYHEPGQVLDADPLAPEGASPGVNLGATAPGSGIPGELSGPIPAPQAVPGPATPTVTTRSTAAEDPNVTAPGSAAAVGSVPAAQIIATIRDLEARADAGDESARAELDALEAAFADDDAAGDDADVVPLSATDQVQPHTPETAPGGNGTAASPAAPGDGAEPGPGPAAA